MTIKSNGPEIRRICATGPKVTRAQLGTTASCISLKYGMQLGALITPIGKGKGGDYAGGRCT